MVQIKLKNFINEIGVATVLGIGYVALKNHTSKVNVRFDEYEYIKCSSFPSALPKFESINPEEFEVLLEEIEYFLSLSREISTKSSSKIGCQFEANRICESIIKRAERMIEFGKKSNNDAVIVAAIDCERDELGLLKNICENTLRNMLLDL